MNMKMGTEIHGVKMAPQKHPLSSLTSGNHKPLSDLGKQEVMQHNAMSKGPSQGKGVGRSVVKKAMYEERASLKVKA